MTLEIVAVYAISACLLIGTFFTVVGAIGLLRFNDSMTRLHAPTKVSTMGIGALLLASMIHSYVFGEGSLHDLLIMAFLFVTAVTRNNTSTVTHDIPPHHITSYHSTTHEIT